MTTNSFRVLFTRRVVRLVKVYIRNNKRRWKFRNDPEIVLPGTSRTKAIWLWWHDREELWETAHWIAAIEATGQRVR